MSVLLVNSTQSHQTGDTLSANETSFRWGLPINSTANGVLVYTFVNASTTDLATAVTFNGVSMTAVSGGRAVDNATDETGDAKAWFLNTSVSPTVTIPRTLTPVYTSANTSLTNASSLVYGNGYWVIISPDSAGTSLVSTTSTGDLVSGWTSRTIGTAPAGGLTAPSCTTYANGYFVTIGASGKLLVTTDPTATSWTEVTASTTTITDVTYANGMWVVVGGGGVVRYNTSTNPSTGTWTTQSIGTTSQLYGVAWGSNKWFVVGASGIMYYSTTTTSGVMPTTWTLVTTTQNTFGTNNIYSIRFGNGSFVAVGASGTSGRIAHNSAPSTTPATWTGSTTPTSPVLGVDYGNGYWLTTTTANTTYYASTLGTWTLGKVDKVSPTPLTGLLSSAPSLLSLNRVAYGNSQWMIAGDTHFLTAAPEVVVTRTNTANSMMGIGVAVAGNTTTLEVSQVVTAANDQLLSETNVSDIPALTPSMRFAGLNSGLGNVDLTTTSGLTDTLTIGSNSTGLNVWTIDSSEINYITSSTTLSTTDTTATTLASGNTASTTYSTVATFQKTITLPYRSSTRNWGLRVVVSSGGTVPSEWITRFRIEKRNSAGTILTASPYAEITTVSATATAYTFSLPWEAGTWSTNDRLVVVWEHAKIAGAGGNRSGTLSIGGASSYATAYPALRSIAVAKETSTGQGTRPVGFNSTTSDDVALVSLVVREYVPPTVVLSVTTASASASAGNVTLNQIFTATTSSASAPTSSHTLLTSSILEVTVATASAQAQNVTMKNSFSADSALASGVAFGDVYPIYKLSVTPATSTAPTASHVMLYKFYVDNAADALSAAYAPTIILLLSLAATTASASAPTASHVMLYKFYVDATATASSTAYAPTIILLLSLTATTASATAPTSSNTVLYLLRAPPSSASMNAVNPSLAFVENSYLVPVSDVSVTNWSPTPIYSRINEGSNADGTKVTTTNLTNNSFEVALTSIENVYLRRRENFRVIYKPSTLYLNLKITVTLLSGSTTIATWTDTVMNAEYIQHYLTSGQMASITSFADLRLRFQVSEN